MFSSQTNPEPIKKHAYQPLTPVTFLERSARAFPNKRAIVCADGEFTFQELLHRTRCLAQSLSRLGVSRSDRVAVLADNSTQVIEAHFAVPSLSAVLVMVNPWLSGADVADLVTFAEAKVLIVDAIHYEPISRIDWQGKQAPKILVINRKGCISASVPQHMDYEYSLAQEDGNLLLEQNIHSEMDPIAINFTSGTTGRPKGVLYSHRAGYLHSVGQLLMAELGKQSKYLWTLPMFHVNGWGHMWACVAIGCTQFIPDVNINHSSDDDFVCMVERYGITHLAGAPRLLKRLAGYTDPALRNLSIMTGGSAPPPTLIQQLEKAGINLIHQYGLNETCGPYVVNEEREEWSYLSKDARAVHRARQGTATIHAGTSLSVVDENGKEVPHDGQTLGEIIMAGNTVALGYYKNPEATEKAFRDGWFHSGDMAVVHPDGNLEIRDRIKDLIYVETNYGWENISSIEIENILCRNEALQDAAVIAISDEQKAGCSPLIVAIVELKAELSEAEFHEYCAAELSEYKRPHVVFFDELPKTNTGKIRKDILNKTIKSRLIGKEIESEVLI